MDLNKHESQKSKTLDPTPAAPCPICHHVHTGLITEGRDVVFCSVFVPVARKTLRSREWKQEWEHCGCTGPEESGTAVSPAAGVLVQKEGIDAR